MKSPYDVNLLIKNIFDQIEDGVAFADAGNLLYMPIQVVNTAFNVLFKTGIFADDCKPWKQRLGVGKTWAQFKIDFGISHQELVESTKRAQTEGFQGNNSEVHQDTIDVIANPTKSNIVDRESMTSLTQIVSHLTEGLTKTQEKLVASLTALSEADKKIKDEKKPSNCVAVSYNHYCHTRGPTIFHPSSKCKLLK